MFESDSQINKIKSCKSEKELWELSEGFIRRIYRLTKYYKGFKSCQESIEKLYQIIGKSKNG